MFQRRKRHDMYEAMPSLTPIPRMQKVVDQHFNTNKEEEDITDAEGLKRAYSSPDRLYKHGDRLYIAGTTWTDDKMDVSKPPWYTTLLKDILPGKIPNNFSLNDAIDDLKIPEFKTRAIQRYKDANSFLKRNTDVKELIGHSMGGSVALQLNKDYNNQFETRTYSAPVFDVLPNNNNDPENERFKTLGDPVAIFDNNARVSFKPTLNPLELHSYNNYGNIGKTQMIKK